MDVTRVVLTTLKMYHLKVLKKKLSIKERRIEMIHTRQEVKIYKIDDCLIQVMYKRLVSC